MKEPPPTDGALPQPEQPESSITPKWVWAGAPDLSNGLSSYAHGYMNQNCTMTMIGPSTAITGGHCVYFNGAWVAHCINFPPNIPCGQISIGAYNYGPNDSNAVQPNGSYYADSVTVPGAWATGNGGGAPGGGGNTNPSHPGWDWDFAILEFSPTRTPGYTTGFYGTEQYYNGTHGVTGYAQQPQPPYDLDYAQWRISGSFLSQEGGRYKHAMDSVGGMSGGCFYRQASPGVWRCTAITSSGWQVGSTQWNEARRWDTTTFNFFDAYANWP